MGITSEQVRGRKGTGCLSPRQASVHTDIEYSRLSRWGGVRCQVSGVRKKTYKESLICPLELPSILKPVGAKRKSRLKRSGSGKH